MPYLGHTSHTYFQGRIPQTYRFTRVRVFEASSRGLRRFSERKDANAAEIVRRKEGLFER